MSAAPPTGRRRSRPAAPAKAVVLRQGLPAKFGPVVTDNGHFVLDAEFGELADPRALERAINMVPGIVECGLFVDMAQAAYFGTADGSILKLA